MPSEFDPIVKRLLDSEDFYRSQHRVELFKYLWEHSPQYSTTEDIWRDVLSEIRERRDRTKQNSPDVCDWESNTRQCCLDLRNKLKAYFATVRDGWHITLALGKRNVGYRLETFRLDDPDSPTITFWRPHLHETNIALVYAQPLFYLDTQAQAYLRFLDTNTHSGSRDEAWSDLETRHPAELQKWYGDDYRKKLRPARNFVGTGEMHALDALARWFQTQPFVAIEKIPNESINTLKGISPILIGSHRTNKFIGTLLNPAAEGRHLRYRLHETKVGHLAIRPANSPEEIEAEKAVVEAAAVSKIRPYEENGWIVVPVDPITMSAERTRFVIVTRMPKPGTSASVTMISSDTSLAIEQMALALTIEEGQHAEKQPQITNILKALGWPERPLPASFEMVFSVKVAPGGFDDEAEAPRLLLASRH